ncbi:glycosyltransferase, partial [Candidatus Berkelbacteria bacterium]|nr:glycosyltransferase [Candidatus Berkelbacteria bacterium]
MTKPILVVAQQFRESASGGGGIYVTELVEQYRKLAPVAVLSVDVAGAPYQRRETFYEVPLHMYQEGNLTVWRYPITTTRPHSAFHPDPEQNFRQQTNFARFAALWIAPQTNAFSFIHLHDHFALPGIVTSSLKPRTVPIISTIHALESEIWRSLNERGIRYDPGQIEKRRALELAAIASDFVTFTSPLAAHHYETFLHNWQVPFDAAKIKVVPGAVNPAYILPKPPRRPNRAKTTVLALGRFDPVKNFELLIDVFR